jgi:hypothetical protein
LRSSGKIDVGPFAYVGSAVGRKKPLNASAFGRAAPTLIAPTDV